MTVSSDNFTNLPVTFLVKNDIENTKKIGNIFQYFVECFAVTMRELARLT